MSNRRRLENRLAELLKKYDAEIEKAFLNAVRSKADAIDLKQLTAAIEAQDLNRAISLAGITRADLFPFDAAITQAYVAGGQAIPAAAPAFAASFGFDGRTTRAATWAQVHVGGLVTSIIDEQRDLIRETIARQITEGIAPRQVAIDIAGRMVGKTRQGGIVGLSNAQAGYLDNARRELLELDAGYFTRKLRDRRFDGIVRKAIDSGKTIAQADVERIAARYSDRMLKHRADTISRTESITALRAGRREGIRQGIDAGAIREDRIKRVWSATLDMRTRPDHVAMDGKEVEGMEAAFELPDGSQMRYPGDTSLGAPASQTVACRCYDEYVVDFLRP